MPWQSPISPGVSWYEDAVPERPEYPALSGSIETDVAIVGGGFTGLQAAYNLALKGVRVTLIDACRFGDGASGRNGGQLGTGQRWSPEDLEGALGFERSKALFDLAEDAKKYLLDFASKHRHRHRICSGPAQCLPQEEPMRRITATVSRSPHRATAIRTRASWTRDETVARLGSERYLFGIRDTGTGHIQPMKLLVGLAKQAALAGASLHEKTKALKIKWNGGRIIIETDRGNIRADRALIACNGYIGNLEPVTARAM